MADFDPYLSWLGIPLNQRPPTAYQLLAMDPGITDPAVIKALALQRAAYVRNFQRGEHGELCSKILEEIAQAETLLADSAKRAAYDRSLKPVAPIAAPKPAPPKATPVVAAPPKAKPVPVQAVAVAVEAVPKRRRARNSRRNSELTMVLAWVGGGVALMVGVAVLVSLMRSGGDQTSASNGAPNSAQALPSVPPQTTANPPSMPPAAQPSTPTTAQTMTSPSNYSQPAILMISFEVPVYDATISIDGSTQKPTKNGGTYPLSPGEHGVEIIKGKTLRFVTRVTLRAGETHDCRVAMSSFKAFESEPEAAAPAPKRVVNLPPHDPQEVVVARYCLEAFSTLTLLKGKVEITHTGRLYELKAPWKEFDDGVEFHVVSNSQGRTIVVDPSIVGKDAYQVVVAAPPGYKLQTARKLNNPLTEMDAAFIVAPKTATARVVAGKGTIVQGGNIIQVLGTLAAFDEGVEVEFSSPGFHSLVLRADPNQLGRNSIVIVDLSSEKTAKKPKSKKG